MLFSRSMPRGLSGMPNIPDRIRRICFWALFLAGVSMRVYKFGEMPGGANPDELWSGWEAYSLLTTGLDSHGYGWPVYLTTWGSGMNVLNTLLIIPFIRIFGLTIWAVRVPQLVVAILSLPAAYSIARRTGGDVCGLASLGILALCPWHVVMSRWGLESHLVVGFLIFGLYFFLKGMDEFKFLCVSAVMYGLSLYCYAAVWPVLPFLILFQFLYAYRCGKCRYGAMLLIPAGILFAFALPLFLFILVNAGLIPEIRAAVFSIPKFPIYRSWTFGFSDMMGNLVRFLNIAIGQTDGMPFNRYGFVGGIYMISLPFSVIGAVPAFRGLISGLRDKSFRAPGTLAIYFAMSFVPGFIMADINSTKMFLFWISSILLAGYGIAACACAIRKYGMTARPVFLSVCAGVYLILAAWFCSYYFTDYADGIKLYFRDGMEPALADAMSDEDSLIYLTDGLNFQPMVLFYSRFDPDEYRGTVVYNQIETERWQNWQCADSFGRFRFYVDLEDLDPDGTYLMFVAEPDFGRQDMSMLYDAGFECARYDYWYVFRMAD